MIERESMGSGPRERTRRAILDAAMSVVGEHPAAPVADIAAAANVGRSTVHRYFPERTDLIRALAIHVHAISSAAIAAADPSNGPAIEALRRVVDCQLDIGPIASYIYNDPTVISDPELMAHLDTGDEAIVEVLARVGTDGSNTPPGWARRVFWALLQAGYEAAKADGAPRHQIVDAIMASLTQGIINPHTA
jgi:TetR/AcrR family transcriptional regulator, repressor for lfrA